MLSQVTLSGVNAYKPVFMPSFASQGSSFPMSLRFLLCQDQKEQDIMRVHFKAMESYGEGNSTSQAMVADKVELIQIKISGRRLDGLNNRRRLGTSIRIDRQHRQCTHRILRGRPRSRLGITCNS